MKTLSILFVLLFCGVAVGNSEPQYVVVLREQKNVQLSGGLHVTLDKGDAFPFVRYLSAAELPGGTANPNDKSNMVLQMDDEIFIVPAAGVRVLEQSEVPAAATTYRRIVEQNRKGDCRATRTSQEGTGFNRRKRAFWGPGPQPQEL